MKMKVYMSFDEYLPRLRAEMKRTLESLGA